MKMKEHTTVCIIGGADGPTSIFLAGNLGGDLSISFILTGIGELRKSKFGGKYFDET